MWLYQQWKTPPMFWRVAKGRAWAKNEFSSLLRNPLISGTPITLFSHIFYISFVEWIRSGQISVFLWKTVIQCRYQIFRLGSNKSSIKIQFYIFWVENFQPSFQLKYYENFNDKDICSLENLRKLGPSFVRIQEWDQGPCSEVAVRLASPIRHRPVQQRTMPQEI